MVFVEHDDFVINMDAIAVFYLWYKDVRFLYKNEAEKDIDFSICLNFENEQKAKWAFDEIIDSIGYYCHNEHIVVKV